MKSIGFTNFRKFKEFPAIDFGDITIFVGSNNAGKSTVVKAILTVLTFLKTARFDVLGNKNAILNTNIYFNKNSYTHIGTFKRALYNKAEDDVITFSVQLEEIHFDIALRGNRNDEHSIAAKVTQLHLVDNRSKIEFTFDFSSDKAVVHLYPNIDLFKNNEDFARRYSKLKEDEENTESQQRLSRISYSRRVRDLYTHYPLVEEEFESSKRLTEICNDHMVGGPLVTGLLYNFTASYEEEIESYHDIYDDPSNSNSFVKVLPYFSRLRHRIDQLLIFTPLVEYLYAHSASQKVLYNSMDTSDFLVETIHNFASQRFSEDSKPYKFVLYWMNYFKIGKDFIINSIGGEAHTVNIVDYDNTLMPLADKGMGTIQIMILLLRLAMDVYNKSQGRMQINAPTTIIIEEPEQNLHPRYQSMLMDLFSSVSEEYKVRFIIETHSEYLIRRSQVLVAFHEYRSQDEVNAKCPYKVYYFPEDKPPYPMIYQANGHFLNHFGSGFFDEASLSALRLSKLQRGRYERQL
jgi:predicted ATP-dependent endonuclease of OLD family